MWSFICNNLIIPLSDFTLGLDVSRSFGRMQKFQWSSEEDIALYQRHHLKNLIHTISIKVPYYQKFFRENNLSKHDFSDIQDLKKLPILTKDTIRNHFSELQIIGHKSKKYVMKSSGSTGIQTTVLIDQNINSDVLATQLLFWEWGGFKMGVPHLQTGMSLKRGSVKKLKDFLFRCYYTSAFELTDDKLQDIVSKIEKKKIRFLFGYASSIYIIANYAMQKKINFDMQKIFTWGDCLYPNYRERIEKVFSCKVQDCYGLGEGLQVAAQCENADSLHIAQHNVIVEITDESGRHDCEKNQLGKVLVTRLSPGPMPLVRYDTGDLAAFPSNRCNCGRKLQLISRIHGRDTDIIRSPQEDRLIVHFFTQIFEMIPQITQFQVRQSNLEELDIYYVPAEKFSPDCLTSINQQIHDNCRFKFKINFHKVSNIPLQKSNKRRFIISTLPFNV